MTIDEAINHCKEVSDSKCDSCGAEHKQLAEWLIELKECRESNKRVYDKLKVERAMFDDSRFLLSNYEAGYADGIKRAMAIIDEGAWRRWQSFQK